MDEDLALVKSYFNSPPGHFWKWAMELGTTPGQDWLGDHPVIEWMGTNTICYEEELGSIITALAPQGLPPLASILLVLTACSNDSLICTSTLRTSLPLAAGEDRTVIAEDMALLTRVVELLLRISQLPQEYRSGSNKTLLMQIIFAGAAAITVQDSLHLVSLFNNGYCDYDGDFRRDTASGASVPADNVAATQQLRRRFRAELDAFEPALKAYPSTEALLQKLRTGVERIPTAAPITLPELPPSNTDLLTQLEEDENTAGLTRLTQRVMAALKIPMHAQGSSDQSFGGVSDITNRGNFDRLLLSELAYDDELLSARLANNEALYLRREELPSQRNKEWVILLDTTLKMWGVPRVFGMAAALACSHNNKGHASLQAYTLGNNSHQPLDLLSKAGIINGLEKMDTALHSGEALLPLLEQQPRSDDRSFFLITNEQTLAAPAFQPALAALYQQPGFIITTNRNGQLHCYELVNGRKKQIATALFDLDEVLFAPPVNPRKKPVTTTTLPTGGWPVIFNEDPFPLQYPSSRVLMDSRFITQLIGAHVLGAGGVLAITQDRRVLYWNNRKKGAFEVMSFIAKGDYYFGFNAESKKEAYLLLYIGDKQLLQLYKISLAQKRASLALNFRMPDVTDIAFHHQHFYVRRATGALSIHADTTEVRDGERLSEAQLASIKKLHALAPDVRRRINSFINNGYSVLASISSIYIDRYHVLTIDGRPLELSQDGRIKLRKPLTSMKHEKKFAAAQQETVFQAPFNPQVTLQVFAWPDGSEAIADSRGLLHLRSADKSIPEICILLVLDQFTACWASDGTTCGNNYFIAEDAQKYVGGEYFYQHYITRFIDSLTNYAASITV